MAKTRRVDCLSLDVVELAKRRILTPEGRRSSRTYGPIELRTVDPLGEQVAASARAFLSDGAGLVKVVWGGGAIAAKVEARGSAIPGYAPWSLLCGMCHGPKRKLLISPSKEVGCGRCLNLAYPDSRRQRSWYGFDPHAVDFAKIERRTVDGLHWLRAQRARDGLPPSENLERLCLEASETARLIEPLQPSPQARP